MDTFVNFVDKKIGDDLAVVEEHFEENHIKALFAQYKELTVSSIIQQFGLGRIFDIYKKGGNLTTLNNAQRGVFANEEDESRFNKNYSQSMRKEVYEKDFAKNRKKIFQTQEKIIDDYTKKDLIKDGRTHRDHIVSASEIQQNNRTRLYMTDKQRGEMATDNKNLAWTDGSLNQSKGEKDFKDWLKKENRKDKQKTNAQYYDINTKSSIKKYKQAKKYIDSTIDEAEEKYYIQGIVETGINQGVAMGHRQAVGLIIYEFQDVLFNEMMVYFRNYKTFTTISAKVKAFTEVCGKVKKHMLIKAKKILITFKEGFLHGFISNLITILINTFTTTAKNMARLLNESIHSLIKAVKLLVMKPEEMSKEEAIKGATKIISTAIITTFGVIMTESFVIYLKTTPFYLLADLIGSIIGSIITGIVAVTVVYAIDNFAKILDGLTYYVDAVIFDMTTSAKKMRESYYNAINTIDEQYELILKQIYHEYEELHILTMNAYDLSQRSGVLLGNSVKLAKALDIDEEEILKNEVDILAFFNN